MQTTFALTMAQLLAKKHKTLYLNFEYFAGNQGLLADLQNGGFSLRSRRICEAAAKLWNEKYHSMGKCVNSSEDIFYTQFLPLHDRTYRRTFRLATNREALRFSWDAIVPIPPPKDLPFGFHGKQIPRCVQNSQ